MILSLITRLGIVVLALLFVTHFIPGVIVDDYTTALIVAIILGVVNITIKPVLFILTLPITLLTLGLFTFVLNAALFWFVASFVEGFEVTGFVPALLGSVIVSLFSWIGNKFID